MFAASLVVFPLVILVIVSRSDQENNHIKLRNVIHSNESWTSRSIKYCSMRYLKKLKILNEIKLEPQILKCLGLS